MKTLSINPQVQNFQCFNSKSHREYHLKVGDLQFLQTPSFPHFSFLQKPTFTTTKLFSWLPQKHQHTHFSSQEPPQPKFSFLKTCAERFAVLLVGSFLFWGRFSSPALADIRNINVPPSLEEKINTQDGKNNEELYLKMLEENPKDVEALKVLLYENMRKGHTKEAVKYVEQLIEIKPDEVEWRLIQALSYELMGQLRKAKRLFLDILEERPLLVRALHGLALVMHKNNEGPAVFQMLNKALVKAHQENRVTEERSIKILIAQMHVVKGDFEVGLKKFQDLVNEDPRDFRPYLCQGIIYSLLDRKVEAEEQFQNYQALVPHEFPQRGFLDDVMIAAKTEPREQLEKEFAAEFSCKK